MKSEIIKTIKRYFKDNNQVIAVYLFGSYAKGKEGKGSDLDIAILLNYGTDQHLNDLKRKYSIGLARILRKDIHILVMNSAGEEIMAQVFRYGQCILNRKPEELSNFLMVRYAMIAEFAYHKKMMRKGFTHRIIG